MHSTAISEKLYFNSIKVRLKRPLGRLTDKAVLFQFHKGTIKTYKFYARGIYRNISIP